METAKYLNTPLDYYSILEKLDEIEWKYQNGSHDEYYHDYDDLFTELANTSAYLYEDIESLISKLSYEMPMRKTEDTGRFWFNTAALLIDETDYMLLLENEGCVEPDDEDSERAKRVRAIKTLTKDKAMELFRKVFNYLMRYLKLLQAYEMLCAMVDELRRLHTFREKDGESIPPPSAYL